MDVISFIVRPSSAFDGKLLEVVPSVNGQDLSALVTAYEEGRGFDVVGGYGGIVPEAFNYGLLSDYYLGASEHRYWGQIGKIAVLGCGDCGEVGCWPLYARVHLADGSVLWNDFEQPHRRDRNYGGLGPFTFEEDAYRREAASLTMSSFPPKAHNER
jgi:hypothetical protein